MELSKLRDKIDDIDDKILELFLDRMAASEEIARVKQKSAAPVLNKTREREILAGVSKKAGENELYAYHLFLTLFALSKARQSEILKGETKVEKLIASAVLDCKEVFPQSGTIACQGVEGANSQAACDKLFPRGRITYVKSFGAVFEAVESGLCEFGVVPIENSTNGSVRTIYSLLEKKGFYIVRSTRLCVRHVLAAKKGVKLEDVREIRSHEQALGQCQNYLCGLKGVKTVPCANTADAAKFVAETAERGAAAIASPQCAELYGLECIARDIQDNQNNYTRFICISKKPKIYPGSNKISLIIACDNKAGALYEILSKFAALGINMSKLESCPISGSDFEFSFFVELEASVHSKSVLPVLKDLERTCAEFVFLGNYLEV